MSFESLRAETEYPDITGIKSYSFALDGGGRGLITQLLAEYADPLMIEVGCYLCGSALQWLTSHPTLRVIGIDPWQEGGDPAKRLEHYLVTPAFKPCFKNIDDPSEFIDSVRRHGLFRSACANVADHRERFVPFRGFSPQALIDLSSGWGVTPDLIYIDANKHGDDLEVAHRLFPDARLCGDDWTWGADQGYPMRRAVEAFVATHGYSVRAERATWVIDV